MHAGSEFSLRKVTVSAEREDGSTPSARVTWSTTIPSECVKDITVKRRTTGSGSVVTPYTTTNTLETEVIQTRLQCNTTYYFRVVVAGVHSLGTRESNEIQVFVGGKVTVCVTSSCRDILMCNGPAHDLLGVSV